MGSRSDNNQAEFDKNFQQIDLKLQNMMNFMADFFTSYQVSQTEMARSSTLTMYPTQQLHSTQNLLNRSLGSYQNA